MSSNSALTAAAPGRLSRSLPVAALAWVAVLGLASGIPQIVLRWLSTMHPLPAWAALLPPAVLAAAWLGTLATPGLRHLRVLTTVLLLSAIGFQLIHLAGSMAAYVAWARSMPMAVAFSAANAAKIVPVALVVGALVLTGRWNRGEMYLRRGDMNASTGIRLMGREVRWGGFGAVLFVVTVLIVAVYVAVTRSAHWSPMALLPFLPIILAGAAINAVCEEFVFRNSILPLLRPLMGVLAAAWLTSLRFGVGHLFGNPGGLMGVGITTVYGLLAVWSMVRTRGSGWAWLLHFANDVAIFAVVAMTADVVYHP
jgi:membrane protease YdiL (CAAX protease family)